MYNIRLKKWDDFLKRIFALKNLRFPPHFIPRFCRIKSSTFFLFYYSAAFVYPGPMVSAILVLHPSNILRVHPDII